MDDQDELREKFRARLNAPPPPPLEAARAFLQSYVFDADGEDEIFRDIKRMAAINRRTIDQGLAGLEALLGAELPPDTLSHLVAVDGNRRLQDPSDAGARIWLQSLLERARAALTDM